MRDFFYVAILALGLLLTFSGEHVEIERLHITHRRIHAAIAR